MNNEIKNKCIANIALIKSELESIIAKKSSAGKPHLATSRKLAELNTFIEGTWAKTLEHANDDWYSEFAGNFASSEVSKRTNPVNSFGEGFACLGSAFEADIEPNMWTK